jgi:hypothetical protein
VPELLNSGITVHNCAKSSDGSDRLSYGRRKIPLGSGGVNLQLSSGNTNNHELRVGRLAGSPGW